MSAPLGQNFLNNKKIAQKIIQVSKIKKGDSIIEVGPGKGILTQLLIKRGAKIIAIELDQELFLKLKYKFKKNKNLFLLNEDILAINFNKLIKDQKINDYKIVANIPYYITSKIIRLFLESRFSPQKMILMVQKEVANRMVAPMGKTSKLSIMVQYYSVPKFLFSVSSENFSPQPKVDSAIIELKIKKQFLNLTEEKFKKNKEKSKKFFRVVKVGFASRRKTLLNNLKNGFSHLRKEKIIQIMEEINLNKNTRAQELSLEKWKKLVKQLEVFL